MKQEKVIAPVPKTEGHALILEARFYTDISDHLAQGAMAVFDEAGMTYDRVEVPGALEIPAALGFAAGSGLYDAYVVLGCVIRGATGHYDVVVNESNRGVAQQALYFNMALGNGILTVENEAQAMERADPAQLDKGGAAARAAIRMLEIKRQWEQAE